MFIHHSVHVDHPIEACSSALASGPRRWFPRLDGRNVSTVGPRIAGVPLRKRVAVEVGEPVTAGMWTEVPLTWKATFPKPLFPEMVGKVELAPVDPKVTRLTVSGMYEPPLGRVGKQLDEALMHNVAQATVKELAESIAKRLDTVIAAHGEQ
jgi:hypothetical protein